MLVGFRRHYSNRRNAMPSTVIPTMRYSDPKKAIEWLTSVAGFSFIRSFDDETGGIVHAELRHGNGAIMIGPGAPTEFGKFIRLPTQVGGFETQITYIKAENLKSLFANMKASKGTEILMPLVEREMEGASFTVRDPFGHVWSFGDYDVWK